ncbi:MAG: cbb3-type cytochrome oxidase assembly protein CcoS [Planctomycetota bacterium]|nr:cbb3-type cytochrome oxidase assembly protein CcoS [Planctomycetota bacterium]
MNVIFVMLPLALVMAGLFVWACVRAIRQGEFDDLETPALRAVFDDEE